jgi:hypothetical protein
MSALIRESHANETQPCWIPADEGGGYATPTEICPSGGITTNFPISPAPPVSLALTSFPTIAGKYYDINIQLGTYITTGASTNLDVGRIYVSVDPPPFIPPTTVGEWANDYRIGVTTDTFITFFCRLKSTANSTVQVNLQAFQVAGSTAQYGVGVVSVTVSELS